jgi:hypothetical protein
MSIISEKIENNIIKVDILSSNIKAAEYDTTTKLLTITFNNGHIYDYYDVTWVTFVKFRKSDSQGKFFNTQIKAHYKYKKR